MVLVLGGRGGLLLDGGWVGLGVFWHLEEEMREC